jgi:hypothetical protein
LQNIVSLHWGFYVALGGTLFWGIDAVFSSLPLYGSTQVWIVSKTIGLPLIVRGAYAWLVHRKKKPFPSAATLMFTGVWLFGPIYMFIVTHVSRTPDMNLSELAYSMLYFPMSTFTISTYSGALGGLVLTTILLLAAALGGMVEQKRS